MRDIAEEITGEWLRFVKKCEFVEYDVKEYEGANTAQTEIDVIAINPSNKEIYICEVAAHVNGLNYKRGRKSTEEILKDKFEKDKFYLDKNFSGKGFADFKKHYMLWSPFVGPTTLQAIQKKVQNPLFEKYGIELELIVNREYHTKLQDLRQEAAKTTKNLSNFPVLRLLQIEEHLHKKTV